MATREPNERLTLLFRETGWTERQLAQAVNRVGAELGVPTQYKQPSAHQWLNGCLPKAVARPLVLEAFARKLRRPVTPSMAGFPEGEPPETGAPSPIDGIVDLGLQDLSPSRRAVVGATLFSVALSVPDWPEVAGRTSLVQQGDARRIGMPDVDLVRQMTGRLGDLYDDFGGRHARPMAAAFLVNTVTPYLRVDATESVRNAMVSAAALLCYLTGWMAVDEGLHGLAQRYYVKGLELAGASADHTTYCHILRGMSVQAADLGHGAPAARLATAASAAAPRSTPRMVAFFAGQQAHAHALAGEHANALHSLGQTEKALDRAESPAGSFGGFNAATLAYATAQVRYAMGDVVGSVASLEQHFPLRDSTDSQVSFLRFKSLLAERQLEIGHLEAACATWQEVFDGRPAMHSDRVDAHLRAVPARLAPYRTSTVARTTYERARAVV
ncbi:tetratricopeptide repeat protein [Streptomyces sp. NPDC002454]